MLQACDHDGKIDEPAYLELLFDLLVILHWLKLLVLGGLVEEEGDFVEAVNDGVVERP